MEADHLLDRLLDQGEYASSNPLATSVLSRALVDMLTWPIKDVPPRVFDHVPKTPRRGPVAAGPQLGPDERRRLFENLRQVADSVRADGRAVLLRRQAYYLASFDMSADTRTWLDDVNKNTDWARFAGTWSPRWAEARSIAAGIGQNGDRAAIEYFVAAGTGDDSWETANLNYFAYWVGETRTPQRDDSFMCRQPERWRGTELLAHLTERLDPHGVSLSLNAHTVWALITARRGILEDDPAVGLRLANQVTRVLDERSVAPSARADLEAVRAGLRLAGIRAEN